MKDVHLNSIIQASRHQKSVVETRGDMGWDWFHLGPVQVLQHTLVLPGTGNIVDSAENIQGGLESGAKDNAKQTNELLLIAL